MKRLLITIDGSANDYTSLMSAMQLTRRLGAELSVVFTALPAEAFYGYAETTAPVVFDNSEEAKVAQERARAAFETACGEWPGATLSTTEEYSADAIARLGPLSDLVIMERLSREEGPSAAGFNAAVFDGAGPVFITAPEPKATIATTPVIAWNGSREAALAVKSAVPLLQLAGRVTVLSGDQSADSLGALKMYLQSYGVAITVEAFTADQMTARGRARALLKTAEGLSADLLVMGAYGENAIGALFGLGRATRKIVTAARMPVLLHH
ncbi:universal stress protein [Thalassobaculum sp.]|uniref:universal stress protein n=1 Tax=Thalassobaculum sp. TaxID=2022740 RepID=UPI0032EC226D